VLNEQGELSSPLRSAFFVLTKTFSAIWVIYDPQNTVLGLESKIDGDVGLDYGSQANR
jgi:hypothetical protein